MINTKPRPIIMVADDDADDRLMMTDAFAEGAIECDMRFAEDGSQLMHLLNGTGRNQNIRRAVEQHPDLIILDLNMPGKSGQEALIEIRASTALRQIPTIIMTTSNDAEDIRSCYSSGASSYIVKPSSYSELLVIVASLKNYWIDTVNLPTRPVNHDRE
jgi:two-component system, response regulator